MTDEEIRAKAKELGIKSYHNKKIDKIVAEIAELESGSNTDTLKDGMKCITSGSGKDFIKHQKFNFASLRQYARELGADTLIYRHNKKAFEAFKGEKSIDFLSIGLF